MPGKYPTALELARAAEADGNTFEARKQYKEVEKQDPENREAAFYLQCYDAAELSVQEITAAAEPLNESFAAALDALPEGDEGVSLTASMAKRMTGLADRWLRAADYTAEHYASTVPQDKQRMQLLTEKRREACARMLLRTEEALASRPGAEDALHSVRKEALHLLAEHPNALPGTEVRKESARLAKLIRQREPDAAMDIPAVSRLGSKKPFIVAGLLSLSLVLYITSAWVWGQLSNATLSILIVGVFCVLLYLTVRKRDDDNKLHAVACAAIFLGTEAVLFLLRMIASGGSGITFLSRGIANPAEIVIGCALLLYAIKGPFKKNWLSLGMLVFALAFVLIYVTDWQQSTPLFHRQVQEYRNQLTQEETENSVLKVLHLDADGHVVPTLTNDLANAQINDARKSTPPANKPVYLRFSKQGESLLYYMDNETVIPIAKASFPVKLTNVGFTTKDSICFIVDSEKEIYLISWITVTQRSEQATATATAAAADTEEKKEEKQADYLRFIREEEYSAGMQTFFILQLLSTLFFDLACAVGFLNPHARTRKKSAAEN